MSSNCMKYATSELTAFLEGGELKEMLATSGPCLSVYAPISTARSDQGQYALRWKECLRSLDRDIEKFDGDAEELRHSISDWADIYDPREAHGSAVAVFRSHDVSRRIWLHRPLEAQAVLGPRFYIRPILNELTRDRVFYVLALSQKNVRLLRCTEHSAEPVDLPSSIYTNFEEYMNPAKPDHVSDNRSSAGPGSGGSKGVMFGTTTEREDKDKYLAHFFGQIDRGLNEVLRDSKAPVILAGVDYELAIYRGVSAYPKLADEGIQGAANSLKGGELHARAIQVVEKCYEHKIDKTLHSYEEFVGAGRATHSVKEAVTAAHDGRVLTLLVSDSMQLTGRFEEATHRVKARPNGLAEEEDLLNAAAVECLLHAGNVLVAPNTRMPNGAPLAAILRF